LALPAAQSSPQRTCHSPRRTDSQNATARLEPFELQTFDSPGDAPPASVCSQRSNTKPGSFLKDPSMPLVLVLPASSFQSTNCLVAKSRSYQVLAVFHDP